MRPSSAEDHPSKTDKGRRDGERSSGEVIGESGVPGTVPVGVLPASLAPSSGEAETTVVRTTVPLTPDEQLGEPRDPFVPVVPVDAHRCLLAVARINPTMSG